MAEREQKKKQAPTKADEDVVEDVPAKSESGEKIKGELDDLLDEIDEVLESTPRIREALRAEGRASERTLRQRRLSVTPRNTRVRHSPT